MPKVRAKEFILLLGADGSEVEKHHDKITLEQIQGMLDSELVHYLRLGKDLYLFYDEDAAIEKKLPPNLHATDLAYVHGKIGRYDQICGPVLLAPTSKVRL